MKNLLSCRHSSAQCLKTADFGIKDCKVIVDGNVQTIGLFIGCSETVSWRQTRLFQVCGFVWPVTRDRDVCLVKVLVYTLVQQLPVYFLADT